MTKDPLVLVVEDDSTIRSNVCRCLRINGFACEEARNASSALIAAYSQNPALILLDLGLPDRDGIEVLKDVRRSRATPVIVLSARGREVDKVRALEFGADDYLTKPFGEAELVARVKAVLRRSITDSASTETPVRFDGLSWDPAARRVHLGDVEIHLTPVEYKLFCAMAARPGRIQTHIGLLREVWGLESQEHVHYVRIAIAGLRKKLEPTPDSVPYLHTEVGVGYRFFR